MCNVLFLIIGFETSTATMSFCLYELCRQPHLQQKIQDEIDSVLECVNNFDEITYDMMNSLKFLDCCIDETLRLYPPLSILFRTCTKDYKIPNTELIIEKGTSIYIPAMGIQRDSKIFDNPLEFIPERFYESPTGLGKGKGLFYISFGAGPRHCIGERMAKMQTKIGLLSILWKFTVEFSDTSCYDERPQFQKTQFFLRSAKPFNLKIISRN
jgi:cytochrome P450 family 6